MSPEERAKKAVDHFSSELGWVHWDNDQLIPLIATAIREAEDAAYERACREIALTTIANIEGGSFDLINGLELAGERIRSLKSQEP